MSTSAKRKKKKKDKGQDSRKKGVLFFFKSRKVFQLYPNKARRDKGVKGVFVLMPESFIFEF